LTASLALKNSSHTADFFCRRGLQLDGEKPNGGEIEKLACDFWKPVAETGFNAGSTWFSTFPSPKFRTGS
jgi:hypothetical protein